MHGVVSLLDAEHEQRVAVLWHTIERDFGIKGVYATPFPHLSYHVAQGYQRGRLDEALSAVATHIAPFTLRTSGVGIFTGEKPVVYVPVVRDPGLGALHSMIWPEADACADGAVGYYAPSLWLPHITVVFGGLDADRLAAVVHFLGGQDLAWEVRIDNLAVISDADGGGKVEGHFPLLGRDALAAMGD